MSIAFTAEAPKIAGIRRLSHDQQDAACIYVYTHVRSIDGIAARHVERCVCHDSRANLARE